MNTFPFIFTYFGFLHQCFSFLSTILSVPWLNLSLSIFPFDFNLIGVFSLFLFMIFQSLCIEMWQIFYINLVSFNFTSSLFNFSTFFFGEIFRGMISSSNSHNFHCFSSNLDNFSFFPFFFFFSGLISVARTLDTILNINDKSEYLCLFLYLKGKTSCASPLSMKLVVGWSWMVFVILRYFPLY